MRHREDFVCLNGEFPDRRRLCCSRGSEEIYPRTTVNDSLCLRETWEGYGITDTRKEKGNMKAQDESNDTITPILTFMQQERHVS